MWKKLLYPILLGVLIFFLIRERHELVDLVQVLRSGSWLLILAAFLFQVLYFIFFSAIYQTGMRAVGVVYKLREMIPVVLSWQVVNVVTGGAGVMGTALLIDDARKRRGVSILRATAGYLLALVFDYIGILLALIIGFGYIYWRADTAGYQVLATTILLILIFLINLLFILAAFRPRALAFILHAIVWIFDLVRRIFHRSAKSLREWVELVTKEFQEATAVMKKHPIRLGTLIFFSLLSHLVNLTCLQLLFLSFGQAVSLPTLIAGYGVGKLFLVISITPQGLGVVEGVMTLVFSRLGVPTPVAAVVVLAFRGMNLWLPVLVGAFTFRRVKGFHLSHSLAEPQ